MADLSCVFEETFTQAHRMLYAMGTQRIARDPKIFRCRGVWLYNQVSEIDIQFVGCFSVIC